MRGTTSYSLTGRHDIRAQMAIKCSQWQTQAPSRWNLHIGSGGSNSASLYDGKIASVRVQGRGLNNAKASTTPRRPFQDQSLTILLPDTASLITLGDARTRAQHSDSVVMCMTGE